MSENRFKDIERHSKEKETTRPASNLEGGPGTSSDRLDGWKRIAQHLGRNVRTLQRWERNEGLPIHRLMHDKQGTVYAYRSELGAWRVSRGQPESAVPSATEKNSQASNSNRRWLWLSVPGLVLAVILAWYWPVRETPAITFGEWDWVLITRFENRTGEQILDDTLEYALLRELSNSPYVKVAPRERIADALALMQLPAETEINVEVGREISLRDGGIRMLISGRIEKLGGTYQLSVGLVNPVDGVTLASLSTDAIDQDQILPQVRAISQDVRAALGESLTTIDASEQMLAKVTTPSLEALQLFSEANRMMSGPDRPQAVSVLEHAVRADPDFASAHLLLVYAYRDIDEVEKATEHLEKAVALAETTSERERLFILATYYRYLGDREKEIETYILLLRLYPDHFWANGNLGNIYESMGMLEQAYPYKIQSAEWRPNEGWPYQKAAEFALLNGDMERARQYVQQAWLFADREPYLAGLLTFAPVFERWVLEDFQGTADAVEEFIGSKSPRELVADWWPFTHARSVLMALGRLDRFNEISALREEPGWFAAMVEYDRGNSETLNRYLQKDRGGFWAAVLLAFDGQTDRAAVAIEDPRARDYLPPPFMYRDWKNFAKGQLALAEGRLEEAIELLSADAMMLNISAKHAHLFAMHSLASAYEGLGRVEEAIQILEAAHLQKPLTIFSPAATWFWLRNAYYLQKLYVKTGRSGQAEDIHSELRNVLIMADPEHPYLRPLEG
jgi:tetratricopeptide (TPR) repeat protein